MSITVIRDTREEISLRSARAVAVDGTLISTGGRDSRRTDAAEAEIDTREMGTKRYRGQAETMDSRDEMGVVTEVTRIHPTSHITNMYSGTDNTPTATEVGWFEG